MARIEGNWGDYLRKLGIQEDTILLPAERYLQTERNLRRNSRVQRLVASRKVQGTLGGPGQGYLITGTGEIPESGDVVAAVKAQFPWARGALVIHVEEVTGAAFYSQPAGRHRCERGGVRTAGAIAWTSRHRSSGAACFRALHDRRQVLLLPNAWDAASACVFADLGFAAIATTSGGVAWSLGYPDGEQAPLAEVIAATRRIVRATALPVSADIEAGYGQTPEAVGASVRALIEAGAAGINLEDGVQHRSLRDVDYAARRIAAARTAARAAGVPIVINARIDVWIVDTGRGPAGRPPGRRGAPCARLPGCRRRRR